MFFKRTKSITTSELEKKLTEKPAILDVREVYEFQAGHIPGAKNLPLSGGVFYKGNEPVYVICQSGMRSRRAVKALEKQGIDAVNVTGGMNAWKGVVKK